MRQQRVLERSLRGLAFCLPTEQHPPYDPRKATNTRPPSPSPSPFDTRAARTKHHPTCVYGRNRSAPQTLRTRTSKRQEAGNMMGPRTLSSTTCPPSGCLCLSSTKESDKLQHIKSCRSSPGEFRKFKRKPHHERQVQIDPEN